jgi:hypothetical protein
MQICLSLLFLLFYSLEDITIQEWVGQ